MVFPFPYSQLLVIFHFVISVVFTRFPRLDIEGAIIPPKTPDLAPIASPDCSQASDPVPHRPRLQAIGADRNTHARELRQQPNSPQEDVVQLEPGLQPSQLDTGKAFDTMRTVEELHSVVRCENF